MEAVASLLFFIVVCYAQSPIKAGVKVNISGSSLDSDNSSKVSSEEMIVASFESKLREIENTLFRALGDKSSVTRLVKTTKAIYQDTVIEVLNAVIESFRGSNQKGSNSSGDQDKKWCMADSCPTSKVCCEKLQEGPVPMRPIRSCQTTCDADGKIIGAFDKHLENMPSLCDAQPDCKENQECADVAINLKTNATLKACICKSGFGKEIPWGACQARTTEERKTHRFLAHCRDDKDCSTGDVCFVPDLTRKFKLIYGTCVRKSCVGNMDCSKFEECRNSFFSRRQCRCKAGYVRDPSRSANCIGLEELELEGKSMEQSTCKKEGCPTPKICCYVGRNQSGALNRADGPSFQCLESCRDRRRVRSVRELVQRKSIACRADIDCLENQFCIGAKIDLNTNETHKVCRCVKGYARSGRLAPCRIETAADIRRDRYKHHCLTKGECNVDKDCVYPNDDTGKWKYLYGTCKAKDSRK